jgi:ribosomal protein S27AE
MKECFKCKRELPLDMFYKHPEMKDGRVNKCKECNKRDVRENRAAKIDYYREYDNARSKTKKRRDLSSRQCKKYRQENRIKYAAHILVSNAIRSGRLIKQDRCSECGESESMIHGHHDDYTKPLEVRWLCARCHNAWHKRNGAGFF